MSQTKAQLIDPVDGTIVNADINASAAIAGTKISPDFGSQNVATTGNLTVDTNTLFVNASNNRVGLGTTSPQVGLDIRNGSVMVLDSADAFITLTATGSIELCRTGGAFIDFSTAGTEDHDCRIKQESDGLAFTTGGNGSANEKLRILSNGRIGIGTSSPSTLMELSGGGNSTLTINTGNNSGDNSQLAFADSADGNVGFINYDHGTNNMQFRVNQAQRMHIDNTGDIGIGSNTINLQAVNRTVVSVNGSDSAALCFNRSDGITGFIFADSNEFRLQAEAGGGDLIRIRNNNGTICQFDDDGIKFNNDTAADNGLDDYEEGQWTPVYNSGITSAGSYSNTLGHYTKIGNTVFFTLRIQMSGSNANFAHLIINGLPYAAHGSKKEGGVSIGYGQALNQNNTAGKPTGHIPQGSSAIQFYEPSGLPLYANNTTFVNLDETIHARGFYYTAS